MVEELIVENVAQSLTSEFLVTLNAANVAVQSVSQNAKVG